MPRRCSTNYARSRFDLISFDLLRLGQGSRFRLMEGHPFSSICQTTRGNAREGLTLSRKRRHTPFQARKAGLGRGKNGVRACMRLLAAPFGAEIEAEDCRGGRRQSLI
jgi:hypothetical protein